MFFHSFLIFFCHVLQRIVDFVEATNNTNDVRQKASLVVQTVFRQYRANLKAIAAGRHTVMVKHHPRVRVSERARARERERERDYLLWAPWRHGQASPQGVLCVCVCLCVCARACYVYYTHTHTHAHTHTRTHTHAP